MYVYKNIWNGISKGKYDSLLELWTGEWMVNKFIYTYTITMIQLKVMNPQITAQKAKVWKININGYISELFSFARVCVWLCGNDTYI